MRSALDVLKSYLDPYLRQALRGRPDARIPAEADVSALLKVLVERWEGAFAGSLPPSARHYAHMLRDVRNRWAHEKEFSDREARHAIDTVWLLSRAIDAAPAALQALDRVNEGSGASSGAAPFRLEDDASPSAQPRRRSRSRASVRRDAHGVILNAEELTADDVAMHRVLCPACREKIFEEWAAGWDAHAEYRCNGLESATPEERKGEFRARFGHLFRKAPRNGKPSQRAVMRQIWARCRCDINCAARAYADAERRGEAVRDSNEHNVSPEDYARALIADGLRKGWLRPCD